MILILFTIILFISFAVIFFILRVPHEDKKFMRRVNITIARQSKDVLDQATLNEWLKSTQSEKHEWITIVLRKLQLLPTIKSIVVQSGCSISIEALIVFSFALMIFGFIVSYICISATIIQIIVACMLGYLPFAYILYKRSHRIAAFNAGLPDAIDMMGRALRAGHSMAASINTVAEQSVDPVSTEFREVFKQQNYGLSLRDALSQMLDHVPSQDLRVLVTGILVQKESGGNLAEILERTSTVIRERLRIQGEIRTHTAQGRMTGWILCSLPIVMLIMINFVNPGYSMVLIYTPIGHKLIYLGTFLLSVGAIIIRSIINGIEI